MKIEYVKSQKKYPMLSEIPAGVVFSPTNSIEIYIKLDRDGMSDIFTDIKYTSIQKEQAVMIVDCKGDLAEQQHIAGILGWRMDDRYKITAKTKAIIRITIL